jgi:sulfur dioxygenase
VEARRAKSECFALLDLEPHTAVETGDPLIDVLSAGRRFIHIMNNLNLPLPDKIMEALQLNTSALDDREINLPTYPQLASIKQLTVPELQSLVAGQQVASARKLVVIDVREPSELALPGEVSVPGSLCIPLRELPRKTEELKNYKSNATVVCVCRVGVRSSTAASVLIGMGFEDVVGLKGGVLAWNT